MKRKMRRLLLALGSFALLCLLVFWHHGNQKVSLTQPQVAVPASVLAKQGASASSQVHARPAEEELDRKIKANVAQFLQQEKANLARRQRELQQMPVRTEKPLEHNPVNTTGDMLAFLPKMSVAFYEDSEELVVYDFREKLVKPALNSNPDYEGTLVREWLFSETPDAYVVKLTESFDQYSSGVSELKSYEEHVADSLIARVPPQYSLLAFQSALESEGYKVNEVLVTNDKGYSHVVINTPSASLDSYEEGVELLTRLNMCDVIGKNPIAHPSKVSNDPYYTNYQKDNYEAIDAPKAWDVRTDSSSVIVAVTDTGVYGYHPDLKENMWWNGGTDNGNYNWGAWVYNGSIQLGGTGLLDNNGHGTHCAGIIGAAGDNSAYVVGVNWNAKIMGVKFVPEYGSSAAGSDMITAWKWAADKGAKVISCSFGGAGSIDSATKDVASYLKSLGVIFVASAGNNGSSNDLTSQYPANLSLTHDNCLSVAATDVDKELASFSSYGQSSVNIAAPGVSILSTYARCNSDGEYEYGLAIMSGTSMATPMVSGSIALLRAQFPNDTYLQILNRLYSSASQPSFLTGKVKDSRLLNIGNAMNEGLLPPMVTATQGTLENAVKITWEAVPGATHYHVYYSEASDGSKISIGNWQTALAYTHEDLTSGKNYYYWVRAATSINGENASEYSSMATGWPKTTDAKAYPDQWDPADDVAGGATALTVTTAKQTTGRHGLVNVDDSDKYEQDQNDYFKFTVSSGDVGKIHYFLSHIEGGSVYATEDLRGFVLDAEGTIMSYNDDIDPVYEAPYNGNYDFLIGFKPQKAGTYYVLVKAWAETEKIFYTLEYQIGGHDMVVTPIELDMEQIGGQGVVTMSSDGTFAWEFTVEDRPSWITKITAEFPDGNIDMTANGTYLKTFEGDGRLVFEVSSNTTHQNREWTGKFKVLLDALYSVNIFQEAGSGLLAPENVVASQGDYEEKILVKWDKVEGANYYRVYRADSESGTPETIDNAVWQTANSFFDSTCRDGQKYWYYVKASQNLNGSDPSCFSLPAMGYAGVLEGTSFKLTVNNGTGSGEYLPKTHVTIEAGAPPVGKKFLKWTGDVSAVQDVTQSTTVVSMPTQDVSVTATYVEQQNTGISPFDGVVMRYDNNPILRLFVSVTINGHKTTANDWIAVFCGSEKRGEAQLDSSKPTEVKTQWCVTGEKLSFKVYDSSTKMFLDCTTTILSAEKLPYTSEEPLEIEVGNVDPYGEPVKYDNWPLIRGFFKVSLYGVQAGVGDIIAVFCNNELRGKASIKSDNEFACVKISRAEEYGETFEFKVFDIDYPAAYDENNNVIAWGKQFDASISFNDNEEPVNKYVTTQGSDFIGASAKPATLWVSDSKKLELEFKQGWTAFSLNLKPSDECKDIDKFWGNGSDLSNVLDMQDSTHNESYFPDPVIPDYSLKEVQEATQYWVHLKDKATVNVDGTECDISDHEFKLLGRKEGVVSGVTYIPYLLQEPSSLALTFESILNNESFKLDHISGSGGGVFYPDGTDTTNTLKILKPGEVYWIFSKDNSGDMTFKFPNVSSQSLSTALAYLAANAELPDYWNEGFAYKDNNSSDTINVKLDISYYGETFTRDNSNILVAAFTDVDNEKLRVSAAGGSSPAVVFDAKDNSLVPYVRLDISEGLDENRSIYFELYDKGLPEEDNPIKSNESFTVDELAKGDVFKVSFGNSETKPTYKVTFLLTQAGAAANSYGEVNLMSAEQIKGDTTPLVQSLHRNDSWTKIMIPRICTNSQGYTCFFDITEEVITGARTYYASFKGLDRHDMDMNLDGKINGEDLQELLGFLKHSYGKGDKGFVINSSHRNGQPHSADTNQDWMIDALEFQDALAYLLHKYKVIEKDEGERVKVKDGEYGYGSGFKILNNNN